jgi:hypothetical protein
VPLPRRSLPVPQDIQWAELRRRSAIVFAWLQAGWTALTPEEREEAGRLIAKSKGRPNRLSRPEARRLGALAGRAASAAAATRRRSR